MREFINIQDSNISIESIAKINFGGIRYDQVPKGTRHVQILLKNESIPTDYYLTPEEIIKLQEVGFLQK